MSELPACVLFICLGLVSYKYIEQYYTTRRHFAIIRVINRSVDLVAKIYKEESERQKDSENEIYNSAELQSSSLFKVFLEVLMAAGITEKIAKEKIFNWYNRGAVSVDNDDITRLTECLGTKLMRELKMSLDDNDDTEATF